jgi:hypothetical protein
MVISPTPVNSSEFVSPLAAPCKRDGCLVTLDGSMESVTIWDHGHLTPLGSTFIVAQVLQPYLKP